MMSVFPFEGALNTVAIMHVFELCPFQSPDSGSAYHGSSFNAVGFRAEGYKLSASASGAWPTSKRALLQRYTWKTLAGQSKISKGFGTPVEIKLSAKF